MSQEIHVYDQWRASAGPEKLRLYSNHRTEIRAEARRRLSSDESAKAEAPAGDHILDKYIAATGADRRIIYQKHSTELRAEAWRRQEEK